MSEKIFVAAVQAVTSRAMSIAEVIGHAGALTSAGSVPMAEQLYRIWIAFNPDDPHAYVAYFNNSVLQQQIGDVPGAAVSLRKSIEINPDFLPGYINLGSVLERQGAVNEAVTFWQAAIDRPVQLNGQTLDYKINALKQLGRAIGEHGLDMDGEAVLRQALDLNPDLHDVQEQYTARRLSGCKWPVVTPWEKFDRQKLVGGIHPLSLAAYTDDPLLQLASAVQYSIRATDETFDLARFDRRDAPIDLTDRRIRVGYVSSDLRDHAIGYLMSEMFELHDRSKVEVFAYYCGPAESPISPRIHAAVEHWVDIRGMTDDEAALRIGADGIDILVDVNGHTRDSRTGIFARRAAPIQVNWLGFPSTMGSPYHQYIIADEWIIPPEFEIYYSEKVLRLPCYQANDRKRVVAPEPPSRRDAGLPDDGFVFCCFNGSQKITAFTFARWMEILKQVPGSVLWLLDHHETTNARLRQHAADAGIEPERLVFAPKQYNPFHLARYVLADLFLDTVPYGAHTTASDALWMGVPVLTLAGRSFASRVCGSLVRAAGVEELICTTPQQYVDRAIELANDPAQLAGYRERLKANRDTCMLFDMDRLVLSLEDLYAQMCADHQAGQVFKPDLTNLEQYLAVGLGFDHEATEMLTVEDYNGLYRSKLAERHRLRPLHADSRLWTAEDVEAADRR
ncbi:N-acetylglucosamine transferase [Caulobacter segnis]|uniref:O-linked N-acetylglucosamine transferase, SPINDLY family protein n=1 Tax=Caulobacter segnis TaxID=88688 RepID=UPI00240F7048|nr:N-acetylglucosamine transferase [Caulobacter segnis]MDG2523497.1 N-acetylglucosamine transferase [Caulobacter segnis]